MHGDHSAEKNQLSSNASKENRNDFLEKCQKNCMDWKNARLTQIDHFFNPYNFLALFEKIVSVLLFVISLSSFSLLPIEIDWITLVTVPCNFSSTFYSHVADISFFYSTDTRFSDHSGQTAEKATSKASYSVFASSDELYTQWTFLNKGSIFTNLFCK